MKQLQPVRCQTCDPGMRAQDSSESGLCRETDDDRSGAGPSAQTKSRPGPVMTRMWSKFPATAGPGRRRAGEGRGKDGKDRDRKRMSTKRRKIDSASEQDVEDERERLREKGGKGGMEREGEGA